MYNKHLYAMAHILNHGYLYIKKEVKMKINTKYLRNYFVWALLLIFSLLACQKDENPIPDQPKIYERGEISGNKSLGTFTSGEIQTILDATGAAFPFSLDYTVEALAVNYYSADQNGNLIQVSGALMLPQGVDNLAILSIQHGTETKRNLVASVSPTQSVEGTIGLLTASMGYATFIPDYPGFGASKMNHPYMHAPSLVPTIIDFIQAGKSYCTEHQITLNGQVFLIGYSEGGFACLAVQKTLEEASENEFEITAVAPLSGPYDLKGMFDKIFETGSYDTPAYAAYFLFAYDEIYGWDRLEEFIKAPYASIIPDLYNGSKTWGEITDQLPASFDALLKPQFIAGYLNGNESEFISALEENTLLNWTPKAPIHFIHGDADQIVPYENATIAHERLIANGANSVQISPISGGTHASSGPAAITKALEWFEEYKQ